MLAGAFAEPLCLTTGTRSLACLRTQAGAQIIQCSQIVKQNSIGAIRSFDLDPDFRADQSGQFSMGIHGSFQAKRTAQPALPAQKSVPQLYRRTIILIP